MAYALYLRRQDAEIPLEEWVAAVEQIPLARIDSGPWEGRNPRTNETISTPGFPGDVAVLFDSEAGDDPQWTKCIRFMRGRGSTNARGLANPDHSDHPIRVVMAQLASDLGAQITGDEGETYEW